MARKGVWVLEQPSSSLVFRLPRFQQLLRMTRVAFLHFKALRFLKVLRSFAHVCFLQTEMPVKPPKPPNAPGNMLN
jgi:hypothetical protein